MSEKSISKSDKDQVKPEEIEDDQNSENPRKESEEGQERKLFSKEENLKINKDKQNISKYIIIGVVLVLLLAAGVYLHFNLNSFFINKRLVDIKPITRQPSSFNLKVNNPEDEFLTFEKSLIVSGVTSEKATIIININQNYLSFEADSSGEFSKVINLDSGVNEIVITAVDDRGNQKTESRTVYYSEEKL